MDTLTIGADPAAQLVFHSRRYAADGWLESYTVDSVAPDLRASVRVGNPGYGHPPSDLLSQLASSWSGWTGKKSWGSMEGELSIDATSDRTGHVTLAARLTAPWTGHVEAAPWSVEARIFLEAGQLAAVAREAEAFFARRAV